MSFIEGLKPNVEKLKKLSTGIIANVLYMSFIWITIKDR
jgi:hypothetical protein